MLIDVEGLENGTDGSDGVAEIGRSHLDFSLQILEEVGLFFC